MKDNFLLKTTLLTTIETLTDEDAGKLFKGILRYANNEDTQLNGLLYTVFIPIKENIDKNNDNYLKRCEINKLNGSKGGAPKGNKNAKKEETTKNNQSVKKTTKNKQKQHDVYHNHISYITNHNLEKELIEYEEEEEKPLVNKKPSDGSLLQESKKIIEYLNNVVGSNYRPTSRENQKHIKARLNEGFTIDDFKQVIDNMATKWLNDEKMSRYLRPETLFGPKFESYLNEIPKKEKSISNVPNWIYKENKKENLSEEEEKEMEELMSEFRS